MAIAKNIIKTTAIVVAILVLLLFLAKNPLSTGAVTANGNLSLTILHYNCSINISMYTGWNLISIKCEQADESITTVLASISGNYSSVEAYYANDTADPWKKYDPSVPPFINDLKTMDHVHGYWINMTANDTLEINGTMAPGTNIAMLVGWNLVGYPSNTSKSVTDALSSINGNYSSVEAYYANDTADPWKKYDPSVPPFINDLNTIDPGYGYWINMTANDTWEVRM